MVFFGQSRRQYRGRPAIRRCHARDHDTHRGRGRGDVVESLTNSKLEQHGQAGRTACGAVAADDAVVAAKPTRADGRPDWTGRRVAYSAGDAGGYDFARWAGRHAAVIRRRRGANRAVYPRRARLVYGEFYAGRANRSRSRRRCSTAEARKFVAVRRLPDRIATIWNCTSMACRRQSSPPKGSSGRWHWR